MKSTFTILMLLSASLVICQNHLADKLVGTYKGIYQNPNLGGPVHDYEIAITKIDSMNIRIAPLTGSTSATFEAELSEQFGMILLKSASDILAANGTFSVQISRLNYAYHLGGDKDRNIEVFMGTKQNE